MRKIMILFCVLILAVACTGDNPSSGFSLTVTDNGPSFQNNGRHIISITASNGSANIYYTLDGAGASKASEKYSPKKLLDRNINLWEGILVEEGTTIKAVGYGDDSTSVEAEYRVEKASSPSLSITIQGTYKDDTRYAVVRLSSSDGSTVYYTDNDNDPVKSGIRYTESLYGTQEGEIVPGTLVQYGKTVKAVTKNEGGHYSETMKLAISSTPAPSLIDAGVSAEDSTMEIIRLASSSSSDIYYTIDCSDPRDGGKLYEEELHSNSAGTEVSGILVTKGAVLRAVVRNGSSSYSMELVTVVSDTFSWKPVIEYIAPSADNEGMEVVRLSSSDTEAAVYYTTDSSDPEKSGIIYKESSFDYYSEDGSEKLSTEGILVPSGTEIKAVAEKNGAFSTQTEERIGGACDLTIDCVYRGISEDGKSNIISLVSKEKSAYIYYTTDGTDPSSNGILYKEQSYLTKSSEVVNGMLLSSGVKLRAVAKKWNLTSNEKEVTLSEASLFAPNIVRYERITKNKTTSVVVKLESSDTDAVILYTTDGSDPATNGLEYMESAYTLPDSTEVSGILLSPRCTLRAVAKNSSSQYSTELSQYILDTSSWSITIVNNGTYTSDTTKQIISITSSYTNASIYYTCNGSSPADNGTLYSASSYMNKSNIMVKGILVPSGAEIKVVQKVGILSIEKSAVADETQSWTPYLENLGSSKDGENQQVIRLVSSDPSVKIYYSTDGEAPETGNLYSPTTLRNASGYSKEGILVKSGTTIKMVAKKGELYSDTISEKVLDASSLTSNMSYTSYADDEKYAIVSLYSENGTGSDYSIYYTTDGSDPSVNGTLYEPSSYADVYGKTRNGVLVEYGKKVYSLVKDDKLYSDVNINTVVDLTSWRSMATNYGNAAFYNSQVMTFSSSDPDAEIYYCDYSRNPVSQGTLYKPQLYRTKSGYLVEGILMIRGYQFKMVAKKGDLYSDVTWGVAYDTSSMTPQATLMGLWNSDKTYEVIQFAEGLNKKKYAYTTDGSDPRLNGTVYESQFYATDKWTSADGMSFKLGTILRFTTFEERDFYVHSDDKMMIVSSNPVYIDVFAGNENSSLYGWMPVPSGDKEGYKCFKSENYNVHNSSATMKITFSGLTEFTIYIKSPASGGDYTFVSDVDHGAPSSYQYAYASTYDKSKWIQSGDKEFYVEVKYTGLTTGEHSIYVVYMKDGSISTGEDRGAVLIPW